MVAERQNTTEADTAEWPLTPQQEAAVDLLSAGRTVTQTADTVGVARQTVSEWLHRHPGFKASLNRRRQETWESLVNDLRSLAPTAVRCSRKSCSVRAAAGSWRRSTF
jgi:predicted transcriptional regulator